LLWLEEGGGRRVRKQLGRMAVAWEVRAAAISRSTVPGCVQARSAQSPRSAPPAHRNCTVRTQTAVTNCPRAAHRKVRSTRSRAQRTPSGARSMNAHTALCRQGRLHREGVHTLQSLCASSYPMFHPFPICIIPYLTFCHIRCSMQAILAPQRRPFCST